MRFSIGFGDRGGRFDRTVSDDDGDDDDAKYRTTGNYHFVLYTCVRLTNVLERDFAETSA